MRFLAGPPRRRIPKREPGSQYTVFDSRRFHSNKLSTHNYCLPRFVIIFERNSRLGIKDPRNSWQTMSFATEPSLPTTQQAQTDERDTIHPHWHCANCRALIYNEDSRCPTCHGRQVKLSIAKEPSLNVVQRLSPFLRDATPVPPQQPSPITLLIKDPKTHAEDHSDRPGNPVADVLASAPSPALSEASTKVA